MNTLYLEDIRRTADSAVIFERGKLLQRHGAYRKIEEDRGEGRHVYEVDGNFGNYRTEIRLNGGITGDCDCPYPGSGCKHVIAVLLELLDNQSAGGDDADTTENADGAAYLSAAEIRTLALEDRHKRGRSEGFTLTEGDMLKGDHLVTTKRGRQYQVTLHDPATGRGHCSCPDFLSNKLQTCKHLIFTTEFLQQREGFARTLAAQHFPYIDIFWDSLSGQPCLFHETPAHKMDPELHSILAELFTERGGFRHDSPLALLPHLPRLARFKQVRLQEPVLDKLASRSLDAELEKARCAQGTIRFSDHLKIAPYAYQKEGIRFGLYRKAVLIGDEMGLGKTLQAIGLGILKKELFGFKTILIVTMSSLKQQWQREIERCSHERCCVIAGSAEQRKRQYQHDPSLFKITNYEAVLRDTTIISRLKPDLIILDEAQRIKNFETKTAEAVKSLPRQHAILLTGTPLENKLEDVYSLVQFLDPERLSPLWQFAADHFLLNRRKKGDILGYTNLNTLSSKLQGLVLRRRKEEVLDQLPEVLTNDCYITLHQEQAEIHAGYSQSLLPLISKKFLTPVDLRRIQSLLLKMRQVCNTTYLIDRESNISPKLAELASLLPELLHNKGRKIVIFSEWTTMTMLIGKELSRQAIPFVELSGKIPVPRRQALIDEFTTNPACRVFLSTDAGGAGLNLQAADCVINFELPWNPARLNQRIGRVNRIGQQSKCINVVNLIAKGSIEERILAGIKLKGDLFDGVFEGGQDEVLLSQKSKQQILEQLRQLVGQEPFIPESLAAEELPEETPHFLNPEVLAKQTDYFGEEHPPEPEPSPANTSKEGAVNTGSAKQMEEVLNQGLGFLSGLLEMATGQKLSAAPQSDKMVTIDQDSGEVTLKFTLPGFTKPQ